MFVKIKSDISQYQLKYLNNKDASSVLKHTQQQLAQNAAFLCVALQKKIVLWLSAKNHNKK